MDTVVTNALTDALTDVAPGAAHPATAQDADALHLHTAMAEACQQACQAIAPAWPLDRAIAVNPHWARTGIPVRQVAARMAVLGGIQVRFKNVDACGMGIPELCRSGGFSQATFYKWRAKFGGMQVSEAQRLRELESENAKLKKLLAEAHLDIHALKSVFGVKR